MLTAYLLVLLLHAALFAGSEYFNRRIDTKPAHLRPDGATAGWVVIGVGYTQLGAAISLWLLYPDIMVLMDLWGPAGLIFSVLMVHMAAYIASGVPMIKGDQHRGYIQRSTATALDSAELYINGNGKSRSG